MHISFQSSFFALQLQDPIPTSLLKMNTDLVTKATKLFQLILKYIGVDPSDRITPISLDERIELVGKLYKQTLKRIELRDELFVQISKQTRNNPERYTTPNLCCSNIIFLFSCLVHQPLSFCLPGYSWSKHGS